MDVPEKVLDLILSQAELANTIAIGLIAALVALIVFLVRQTAGLDPGRIAFRAKKTLSCAIICAGLSSLFYYLLIGNLITSLRSLVGVENPNLIEFFRSDSFWWSTAMALFQGGFLALAVAAVIAFAISNRKLIR